MIRLVVSAEDISIHALREEGDVPISCIFAAPTLFLSTPSARRATKILDAVCRVDGISIHALREEGDIRPASWPCGMRRFLSTPSARRATDDPEKYPDIPEFLSTPSARRATEGPEQPGQWPRYFYPRPPRGGRLGTVAVTTGDDLFLSTPSARRATRFCADDIPLYKISIHALREEGDLMSRPMERCHSYFYPRPPRGGRLVIDGGAAVRNRISIHALREEGDTLATHQDQTLFISIHALREEGDAQTKLDIAKQAQFLSTPSARRATKGAQLLRARRLYFYPRPPRGGRQPRSGLHGRQC